MLPELKTQLSIDESCFSICALRVASIRDATLTLSLQEELETLRVSFLGLKPIDRKWLVPHFFFFFSDEIGTRRMSGSECTR